MPKWKTRTCEDCQKQEWTASSSPVCLLCFKARIRKQCIVDERQRVLSVYGNVEGPTVNNHGKRCYTFTHSCGTTQTWVFGNLAKQWLTKQDPCSKCGATERIKPAMAGYVAKYQLDERARTDLRAYTRKVRGLSEKTYRENIDTLNPQRLKRGRGNQGYHLDHIISIVECFKRGRTPEQAAALDNLQLLEAGVNLRKGRSQI